MNDSKNSTIRFIEKRIRRRKRKRKTHSREDGGKGVEFIVLRVVVVSSFTFYRSLWTLSLVRLLVVERVQQRKKWGEERTRLRDKKFRKTQKKENYSSFRVKTGPNWEPKRKKEKERANATTRIIILSIAQYHHHLLCERVIFHYSN